MELDLEAIEEGWRKVGFIDSDTAALIREVRRLRESHKGKREALAKYLEFGFQMEDALLSYPEVADKILAVIGVIPEPSTDKGEGK